MGHQAPGPICGHKVGTDYIDAGTTCRSRNTAPGATGRHTDPAILKRRQRAIAAKAADARTLLQTTLPFVYAQMNDAQVEQMQRVLDAVVLDPLVEKEADEIYRRSVIASSGSIVLRDEKLVRRSYRLMEQNYIPISKADQRIRLDVDKLLDADALKPVTDNPDEAAYLGRVKQTLANKGVWLRFSTRLVRDPGDPSRHVVDPRSIEVWLSLGPDGDTIPTKSGKLTRDALLRTTLLGAGYYEKVYLGPVQAALEKEVRRLTTEIDAGLEQHQQLAAIRRKAFPGVVEVSDALGRADFPSQSIWDPPHRFVLKAMELNVGGNVRGSQAFLLTAAVLTRNAAHQLASYIDATSSGAERAVKVLKVARTAGHVAEIGLAVTGIYGLARGGAALAGGGAAEAEVDALAEKVVKDYVAKNPEIAGELGSVRWVPGPKGSIGSAIKPGGSSGYGTGWHKWP